MFWVPGSKLDDGLLVLTLEQIKKQWEQWCDTVVRALLCGKRDQRNQLSKLTHHILEKIWREVLAQKNAIAKGPDYSAYMSQREAQRQATERAAAAAEKAAKRSAATEKAAAAMKQAISTGLPQKTAETAAATRAEAEKKTAPAPRPTPGADVDVSKLNYMKLKRHMKDNGFTDAEVNAAPGKPTLLHMWNAQNK